MPRPNLARSSRLDDGIRQSLTETASVRDFWNILPNVTLVYLWYSVLAWKSCKRFALRDWAAHCRLPLTPNMIAINTSGNRVACLVLMLPDEAIKAQGVDPQETYRREIAHCSGWPADHGGAQWQRKTVQQ